MELLEANGRRMALMMNQLSVLLHTGFKSVQQLEHPLLALARNVDLSVANGDVLVPSKASELCSLVKQLCQWNGDYLLLPPIMVLMISIKVFFNRDAHLVPVLHTEIFTKRGPRTKCASEELLQKNACPLGWFSAADSEVIINLYKEISSSFSLPQSFDEEMSPSNPHMQTIMDRFYPQLSLGNIFACLDVKPGYGAYLVDFYITKDKGFSPQENIRLFVAQTDTTETSSCLKIPQRANFLLNGKGIVGWDTGPHAPANVTPILKFGTNLLQVVGHFPGNYVIAIAMTRVISFSIPNLEYVQLDFSQSSDSDVIMGPSRVCLNCPISRKRIKTPVKGRSCKHFQCFDLENYVEINSRRPSWRCPHCNQSVCFLDIRIDNNMMKILNEAGHNVEDVIIYPDGSWNNTPKNNGDATGDTNDNQLQESDAPDVDLTMERDVMDTDQIPEDGKSSQADLLNPTGPSAEMLTEFNILNEAIDRRACQMDDDFWSGLDLSGYNPGPTNDGIDSVHSAECAPDPHLSSLQSVNVPVQQPMPVNSEMSNQHMRVASIPLNTTRAQIAQQALAATSGSPNSRLTSGAAPASMISGGMSSQGTPSINVNADGYTIPMTSEVERLREYSRSVMRRLQLPEMNMHRPLQQSVAQSRDAMQTAIHNLSNAAASMSTTQFSNAQRAASVLQVGHQNHLNQQPQQSIRPPNVSAGMVQIRPHISQTNHQQALSVTLTSISANLGRIPARPILNSRPVFHLPRQQTAFTHQNQTLYPADVVDPGVSVQHRQGVVQQVSRAENLVSLPPDTNVRPAGRMRGSLSGSAYEGAFNKFMSPATRGAPRPTSQQAAIPPELQEMIKSLPAPDSGVSYP